MAKKPLYKCAPINKEEFIARVVTHGHHVHGYETTFGMSVNSPLGSDGMTKQELSVLLNLVSDPGHYPVSEVTTTFAAIVGDPGTSKDGVPHTHLVETFFEYVYENAIKYGDPRMAPIERKEFLKAGPYVGASSQELAEKFVGYLDYDFDDSSVKEELHEAARKVGRELSHNGKLRLMDLETALIDMTKGTNFGAPYFTRNWGLNYDPEAPDFYMSSLKEIATLWSDGDETARDYVRRLPSTLFNRTVPDGRSIMDAKKKRATFAPSKYEAIISKRVSSPTIEAFKGTSFGRGYAGNHEVGPLIQEAILNSHHVISLDYSAFDQTAKDKARYYVRVALLEAFEESAWEYITALTEMHDNPNLNTPFGVVSISPDSNIRLGLQSGLGLTGCYGTIWNRILAHMLVAYLREEGLKMEQVSHFCYGDDTLLAYRGEMADLAQIEDYLHRFNMNANHEKQDSSSHNSRWGVFCQKYYLFYPSVSDVPTFGPVGTHTFGPIRHSAPNEGGAVVSDGIHSVCRMAPRLVYKDVTKDGEWDVIAEAKEGTDNWTHQIIETLASLHECENHPAFYNVLSFIHAVHPLHLITRQIFDRVRERNRVECGGSETISGLTLWHTTKALIEWEDRVGLSFVYEEWPDFKTVWEASSEAKMLLRITRRVYRDEGYWLTKDQCRSIHKGEIYTTTKQQANYKSMLTFLRKYKHADWKAMVLDFVLENGITLSNGQISKLLTSNGIGKTMTQAQVEAKSLYKTAKSRGGKLVRKGKPTIFVDRIQIQLTQWVNSLPEKYTPPCVGEEVSLERIIDWVVDWNQNILDNFVVDSDVHLFPGGLSLLPTMDESERVVPLNEPSRHKRDKVFLDEWHQTFVVSNEIDDIKDF